MLRKVIVDCDMGTDDAVALCVLLFDQRLEVLALTAVEGCVTADQANSNLQAILGELDPQRYPRLGHATPAENAPAINSTWLYGEDGLGNCQLEVSAKQHVPPAEKVIIETVRNHPGAVTLVCLGPLTNIARALRRDPAIATLVNRIVMVGGSMSGIGNITPMAEFNFYFDPASAREVMQSKLTKTLVPLDVTSQVAMGLEVMSDLPGEESRTGFFLRQMLPHAFRSYRQHLGQESITLNDAVGALAVIEPELFEFDELACDIETEGELTRGVSVFDRRNMPDGTPNVEVAIRVDSDRARQTLLDLLVLSGKSTTQG